MFLFCELKRIQEDFFLTNDSHHQMFNRISKQLNKLPDEVVNVLSIMPLKSDWVNIEVSGPIRY